MKGEGGKTELGPADSITPGLRHRASWIQETQLALETGPAGDQEGRPDSRRHWQWDSCSSWPPGRRGAQVPRVPSGAWQDLQGQNEWGQGDSYTPHRLRQHKGGNG